jgi:hypothetical protein
VAAAIAFLTQSRKIGMAEPSSGYGLVWWGASGAAVPPRTEWLPIRVCHEWDGQIQIIARSAQGELQLIAWCDGYPGTFTITTKHQTLRGTTKVAAGPAVVEEDGHTFPAGAYFCAGDWLIECDAESGEVYLVHAEVRDWTATD